MKRFLEYINETKSGKNLHLSHLEESVLDGGIDGTRKAIKFLQQLRNTLAGNSKTKVNITTKFDGCLHEDTKVVTDKGNITIKEVIENIRNGDEILVKGKQLDTNEDNWIPIANTSITTGNKSWVKIQLENGESFTLTEDHEVHTTNRGWVEAKDLTENDDITELSSK